MLVDQNVFGQKTRNVIFVSVKIWLEIFFETFQKIDKIFSRFHQVGNIRNFLR